MSDDTTTTTSSPRPRHRGVARAFVVILAAGCAAKIVGVLTLLVSNFALPDESLGQTVVALVAYLALAAGSIFFIVAILLMLAQLGRMLVRAARPT